MKDKYKIQIGDTLFEYNEGYRKIFEWEVLEIWLEDYICGNKTILKCSNGTCTHEFFAADVLYMYRNREEAEKALKECENNGC